MNQHSLQRKNPKGSACETERADEVPSGTSIDDLGPTEKSLAIIGLLRRLDKQQRVMDRHRMARRGAGCVEPDMAAEAEHAEQLITLLSAELDAMISSLTRRVGRLQNVVARLDRQSGPGQVIALSESGAAEGGAAESGCNREIGSGDGENGQSTQQPSVPQFAAPKPAVQPGATWAATEGAEAGDALPTALPAALPAAATAADDEDDDDDDDEDEVDEVPEHLFSLLEHYQSSNRGKAREVGLATAEHAATTAGSEASVPAIEILTLVGGELRDVRYVKRGESHHVDLQSGKRFRLARHTGDGRLQYFFSAQHFSGEIRSPASESGQGEAIVAGGSQSLPERDLVQINAGASVYLLRRVAAIASPLVEIPRPNSFWRGNARNVGLSAGVHLVAMVMLGLVLLTPRNPREIDRPEFVQVDVQAVLPPAVKPPTVKPPVAKPAVAKPPVRKPEPENKPAPRKAEKIPEKKAVQAKAKVTPQEVITPPVAGGADARGGNLEKRNVKQSGLLATLGSTRTTTAGAQTALAKVSSLDAVNAPRTEASTLKVAGLTAKVEGARMTIPTGALLDTRGSAAVLRSGGGDGKAMVAALERGGTGQGAVNAMVSAELSKSVRIQGGMSREAVKKVIDAHMDEVVYCYESALLGNAALSGKAVFEWKILESGQVGETRIQSTTLRSDSIHGCITSAIKAWRFPQPQGAEVLVSYPFIFDMVGF